MTVYSNTDTKQKIGICIKLNNYNLLIEEMELHYKLEVQTQECPIEQTNLVHSDYRSLLQLAKLRNSALRIISMAKDHEVHFRSV